MTELGAAAESFRWREFASAALLAQALAADAAAHLAASIAARGSALLAVSGGTTPKLFLQTLSRAGIDWGSVTVTLCDERFVDPSSPRSNEGLVRAALLAENAARARFVPLFHPAADAFEAAHQASAALARLPLPLDLAVLGMGADGHTASFFPDADLRQAFAPEPPRAAVAILAPSGDEPRITLSLPVIAAARRVVLHIETAAKRDAFERAMTDEPALPVRTVVERSERPVDVFWAP